MPAYTVLSSGTLQLEFGLKPTTVHAQENKAGGLTSVRDCSLLFISYIRYSGCTMYGVCLL